MKRLFGMLASAALLAASLVFISATPVGACSFAILDSHTASQNIVDWTQGGKATFTNFNTQLWGDGCGNVKYYVKAWVSDGSLASSIKIVGESFDYFADTGSYWCDGIDIYSLGHNRSSYGLWSLVFSPEQHSTARTVNIWDPPVNTSCLKGAQATYISNASFRPVTTSATVWANQ